MPLSKIYIELTDKCNLNCSVCYRNSWNETTSDMSDELFEKLLKDIDDVISIKTIVLGGIGEPLCSPLIEKAIKSLKQFEIILTTNALDINDTLLSLIVGHVKKIIVSVDGMHDSFSKIRGADLEKIISNIDRINNLKKTYGQSTPYLSLQCVISKDNIGDVFDIIDLSGKVNAHTLILANLIPHDLDNNAKILYTRYENPEMASLFKKIISYSGRKGVNIIFPNIELKTERRCSFIDDDAAFVSAAGELAPCYRMSHNYVEFIFGRKKAVLRHSFGNLKDASLIDIWESREYESFRNVVRNNLYPSCIDCDLASGCDMSKETATDCYGGSPSCADCLWSRKITSCP